MITVTNCGHDSHHPKPCNIEHSSLPEYLLLFIKKEAWMECDGIKTILPPNSVILFSPRTYIHYGCDTSGYNDDWIHFFCDDEETFLSSLDLPMGKPFFVYDFHHLSEYVKLLSDTLYSTVLHKERILDALMHALLPAISAELELRKQSGNYHKYLPAFSRLRTNIYNDPSQQWSVAATAQSLFLSTSYFQHLYQNFFGCSCQQDLITARIEMAKLYLDTTEMSIHDLSDFCGYESESHFMRQFKKRTSITPSEYRSLHRQKQN